MSTPTRPLSPHLQIYKPQLTSVLSITHRATGVALSAGAIFLVIWLAAAAAGPARYAQVNAFLGSWFGMLLLIGWTWALFFHLCNGIRHLAWDVGWGFELPQLHASGWAVVAGSVALTVIAWAAGLLAMGG
ncbi:MAG: succinate dehydrogenase, cytochrome b556 subunit [Alphaproteobacteria bacterium]|nr:succinate dehydrogenase, cytochrome b556 subunit [Alphaproteobacteria bacterium]